MSTQTKTRIVVVGLALFTLWPLAHLFLVARYDISPWKLAGWGMYAAPRPSYRGMEIYGRAPGDPEPQRLIDPSAELAAEAGQFLERYRWLRRLARPDDLVRAVRAARPDWQDVRVSVFRSHVEPDTGMVVMKEHAYDYPG